MIKKIFSILLIFCILNFISAPAMATSQIVDAEFKTDLNLNKASNGQVVQFVSTQDCVVDNFTIPAGTIFSGEVGHLKKGRFGYRRAKGVIKIDKIILPDGETLKVDAFTKRHVLKGSAIVNVGKGIISFPIAIAIGAVGVVVIVVEAISIAGILLIGPTMYLLGETAGKLTHGVNYKKHQGDEIQLKIKKVEAP